MGQVTVSVPCSELRTLHWLKLAPAVVLETKPRLLNCVPSLSWTHLEMGAHFSLTGPCKGSRWPGCSCSASEAVSLLGRTVWMLKDCSLDQPDDAWVKALMSAQWPELSPWSSPKVEGENWLPRGCFLTSGPSHSHDHKITFSTVRTWDLSRGWVLSGCFSLEHTALHCRWPVSLCFSSLGGSLAEFTPALLCSLCWQLCRFRAQQTCKPSGTL